jgi:hypothetical protein
VPGFDRFFHIGVEIILQVEVNDFTTRVMISRTTRSRRSKTFKNQLAPERSDVRGFFALLEDQSQFLFAVCKLARGNWLQPSTLCKRKFEDLFRSQMAV